MTPLFRILECLHTTFRVRSSQLTVPYRALASFPSSLPPAYYAPDTHTFLLFLPYAKLIAKFMLILPLTKNVLFPEKILPWSPPYPRSGLCSNVTLSERPPLTCQKSHSPTVSFYSLPALFSHLSP